MPGMKLGFIKNAVQRIAQKRGMPAQHLEAVIVYGKPEQRVKALKKVMEESVELSLHKETHQLVLAIMTVGDATKRVELLYALRGKIRDLARNRFGNIVLQKLIELSPPIQRREIAESLLDEAVDLIRHPFGNHVLQKLLQYETSRDVLLGAFMPELMTFAVHAVGQHVVAALIAVGEESVIRACMDPPNMAQLAQLGESAVLTELCKSTHVSDADSTATKTFLRDHVADFETRGEQHFALVAAVDSSDDEELKLWVDALKGRYATWCRTKGLAEVVAALSRRVKGKPLKDLTKAFVDAFESPTAASQDPYGSMVLRSIIAADVSALPKPFVTALLENAGSLSEHPASAVVVQRLCQYPQYHDAIGASVAKVHADLLSHSSGAHVIQAVLENCESQRSLLCAAVLERATDLVCDPHGTFVLQKAIAVGDSATVVGAICDLLKEQLIPYCKDNKGCYVVAAALQAAKKHDLPQAKTLMDSLKPHVTTLAVLPWSGRIVLEAMFAVGSAALKSAIKEVIFLKCEMFLSEPHSGNSDGAHQSRGPRSRSRSAPEERPKRNRAE